MVWTEEIYIGAVFFFKINLFIYLFIYLFWRNFAKRRHWTGSLHTTIDKYIYIEKLPKGSTNAQNNINYKLLLNLSLH